MSVLIVGIKKSKEIEMDYQIMRLKCPVSKTSSMEFSAIVAFDGFYNKRHGTILVNEVDEKKLESILTDWEKGIMSCPNSMKFVIYGNEDRAEVIRQLINREVEKCGLD